MLDVNKGENIELTLQLIKSDGISVEQEATVSYRIFDSSATVELVSSQVASYNSITQSYTDTLVPSASWSNQEVGHYLVVWSVSDTMDDFNSVYTEQLNINIDKDLIADTITETTSANFDTLNTNVLAASADIRNDFIDLNTKVDSLSASNQTNFNNLNSVITNYTTQILNSMSGIDTRIISLSASNKLNFDVISSLLTSYTTDILTEIGITDTRIISLSASNQTNFNTVNSNISSISISAATPQQIAQAVWSENPSGYSGLTSFGGLTTNMSNDIKRLLGLTHENIFIDNPTYDGDGNMTSARVRIYSNPSSVGTGSDVIGTYQVSAPSSAPGQFITWSQIRSS